MSAGALPRPPRKPPAAKGITIERESLAQWLSRDDIQAQLAVGGADAVKTVVADLQWRLSGLDSEDRLVLAEQLLAIVLFTFLAEGDPAKATAHSATWVINHLVQQNQETRETFRAELRPLQNALVDHLSEGTRSLTSFATCTRGGAPTP